MSWWVSGSPPYKITSDIEQEHGPYETLADAIRAYHDIKRRNEPVLTIGDIKQRKHPF